jgi:two-component system chemotaxis response regulator CheB
MPTRDIIVVGASSGGLDALKLLVRGLPADLPAAVFVVWHIAPESPNMLPEVLRRLTQLAVVSARNGEPIVPGTVYVAPPDRHLLLAADRVRVTFGPKENRFRPAIDALFRSAAFVYGPRVIGVVLTGQLDDGTAGLWAIKDRGGLAIIQDPAEAAFPSMPNTARQYVAIDHELPAAAIGPLLGRLSAEPVNANEARTMSPELEIETRIAENTGALSGGVLTIGEPSPYSCPDCDGVLMQMKDGGIPRFRCHTGHAYSAYSLLAAVSEDIEREMWSTARALEESIMLLKQLERHVSEQHDAPAAKLFREKAQDAEQRVSGIRSLLARQETITVEELELESQPKKSGKNGRARKPKSTRKSIRRSTSGRNKRPTRKTAAK